MSKDEAIKAISAHALHAFLGGPYSRVSVREIAARSGYSHTYVHSLYGNKRELFLSAATLARQQLLSQANVLPTDDRSTVVLKVLNTNPLEQPIVRLIRKAVTDTEMLGMLRELWETHDGIVSAMFSHLQGKGIIPGLSVEAQIVAAMSIIWAGCAAEVVIGTMPELSPEAKARVLNAPQELLLATMGALLKAGYETAPNQPST